MMAAGLAQPSLKGFAGCLLLLQMNWFIKAYLALCILAPILNAFIDVGNERNLRRLVFWFFAFQIFFGWISNAAPFIMGGYSAFSFIGLYLLARYVRLYPPRWAKRSRGFDLAVFSVIIIGDAALCYGFSYMGFGGHSWVLSYISPTVIASALFLLLFFSKLRLQSKAVNFVAASSFAVFLLHTNPNICLQYFKPFAQSLYADYSGLTFLALTALFVLSVYVVAVLIDQPRKWLWRALWPRIERWTLRVRS